MKFLKDHWPWLIALGVVAYFFSGQAWAKDEFKAAGADKSPAGGATGEWFT